MVAIPFTPEGNVGRLVGAEWFCRCEINAYFCNACWFADGHHWLLASLGRQVYLHSCVLLDGAFISHRGVWWFAIQASCMRKKTPMCNLLHYDVECAKASGMGSHVDSGM